MGTTPRSDFAGRPATRVTLLMSVHDRARRHSLQMELLRHARRAHLAGATVFEGDEGYGQSGLVHSAHVLSDDRPLAMVIVDTAAKVDGFLDAVAPLLDGVLVTLHEVEILDV